MLAPTICGVLRNCHLESGNIMNISAAYNRADAVAIHTDLNANLPSGEEPDGLCCELYFIPALLLALRISLPLEGKVSAKPTDEVFIQIQHRLCHDRQDIK